MKSLLKYTSFAAVGALALGVASTGPASSATELVVVSWGGAYTASQQKAYHEPYMKLNPDITILNDDSAAEGLAKLRAQAEAGNVTWDLVDMVASDAIGMGLNLNIQRVVFAALAKYDGEQVRPLDPTEVKQIAGRCVCEGSVPASSCACWAPGLWTGSD